MLMIPQDQENSRTPETLQIHNVYNTTMHDKDDSNIAEMETYEHYGEKIMKQKSQYLQKHLKFLLYSTQQYIMKMIHLMLRYPKRSGDQSCPCRIKLFWLWTIPSTTNNLMNNQDLNFSSLPKDYTSIGTILDPKLMIKDHKQDQTPIDPTTSLLHNHQQEKVIMTK